ncbi:hypothetical protein [Roseibium sp.]|uniref:hypothetical protein n=1 Tax=Roseibium sp. TaxID=1936156 RepID=UPI003D09987C
MNQKRADPVIGYGLAVLVASVVCVVFLFAGDVLAGRGDLVASTGQLLGIMLYGTFITAVTAWPGYWLTLFASKKLDYNSLPFFMFCGLATTYSAVFIAALTFWGRGAFWLMLEPGLYAGGAAGGLAYGLYVKCHLMADDA